MQRPSTVVPVWRDRYPRYNDRMAVIANTVWAWLVSNDLDKLSLQPLQPVPQRVKETP